VKQTLFDWFGTFWKVLVSPTPVTFRDEAQKAHGKFASAGLWLFLFSIYIAILINWAVVGTLTFTSIVAIVAMIPTAVILFAAVLNFFCSRLFHRKDHYDELLYVTVAVLLPIFIIFAPLAAFIAPPIFSLIGFILLLYQVAQLTVAVKTIVNIEYWQSFVTVVLAIMVGIVMGFIIFVMIFSTVSPQMPRLLTPTPTQPQ
jgi:4-amino-4-deoxy-L-arabinose transferase-like glycosyltransferase